VDAPADADLFKLSLLHVGNSVVYSDRETNKTK